MIRITVDPELCEGNARCASVAPELFTLGEDDKSRVTKPTVPEALREKAILAVRLCPRQAITISE
jgi:ferredoxin